jgi:putative Mg2+ transporter-C (MgtC) family protein
MMSFFDSLSSSETFQIVFKLVLSSLLAGVIGIERSALNKPAGFGTHAIIGLSSALIVMGSQYMSLHFDIDAARIPAQILTGIGFIGAGTIIQNGYNVRGVTTAAGILSVTCIGITVGMGYYIAAILATMIVFIILSVNHEVAGKVERYESTNLLLTIDGNVSKAMEEIKKYFKENNISIQAMSREDDVIKNKKSEVVKFSIMYMTRRNHKVDIISYLAGIDYVSEVKEE